MGDFNAIREVSNCLKRLIEDSMNNVGINGIEVTFHHPDQSPTRPTNRINFFLYFVSENANMSNFPFKTNPVLGTQTFTPLSLNLYFLMTPYLLDDTDSLVMQRLIAGAMRILQENSIIPREYLRNTSLDGNHEDIKITLNKEVKIDELTKIWSATTKPFRISIPYLVSVVEIEETSLPTIRATKRVEKEGIRVDVASRSEDVSILYIESPKPVSVRLSLNSPDNTLISYSINGQSFTLDADGDSEDPQIILSSAPWNDLETGPADATNPIITHLINTHSSLDWLGGSDISISTDSNTKTFSERGQGTRTLELAINSPSNTFVSYSIDGQSFTLDADGDSEDPQIILSSAPWNDLEDGDTIPTNPIITHLMSRHPDDLGWLSNCIIDTVNETKIITQDPYVKVYSILGFGFTEDSIVLLNGQPLDEANVIVVGRWQIDITIPQEQNTGIMEIRVKSKNKISNPGYLQIE